MFFTEIPVCNGNSKDLDQMLFSAVSDPSCRILDINRLSTMACSLELKEIY